MRKRAYFIFFILMLFFLAIKWAQGAQQQECCAYHKYCCAGKRNSCKHHAHTVDNGKPVINIEGNKKWEVKFSGIIELPDKKPFNQDYSNPVYALYETGAICRLTVFCSPDKQKGEMWLDFNCNGKMSFPEVLIHFEWPRNWNHVSSDSQSMLSDYLDGIVDGSGKGYLYENNLIYDYPFPSNEELYVGEEPFEKAKEEHEAKRLPNVYKTLLEIIGENSNPATNLDTASERWWTRPEKEMAITEEIADSETIEKFASDCETENSGAYTPKNGLDIISTKREEYGVEVDEEKLNDLFLKNGARLFHNHPCKTKGEVKVAIQNQVNVFKSYEEFLIMTQIPSSYDIRKGAERACQYTALHLDDEQIFREALVYNSKKENKKILKAIEYTLPIQKQIKREFRKMKEKYPGLYDPQSICKIISLNAEFEYDQIWQQRSRFYSPEQYWATINKTWYSHIRVFTYFNN